MWRYDVFRLLHTLMNETMTGPCPAIVLERTVCGDAIARFDARRIADATTRCGRPADALQAVIHPLQRPSRSSPKRLGIIRVYDKDQADLKKLRPVLHQGEIPACRLSG